MSDYGDYYVYFKEDGDRFGPHLFKWESIMANSAPEAVENFIKAANTDDPDKDWSWVPYGATPVWVAWEDYVMSARTGHIIMA